MNKYLYILCAIIPSTELTGVPPGISWMPLMGSHRGTRMLICYMQSHCKLLPIHPDVHMVILRIALIIMQASAQVVPEPEVRLEASGYFDMLLKQLDDSGLRGKQRWIILMCVILNVLAH